MRRKTPISRDMPAMVCALCDLEGRPLSIEEIACSENNILGWMSYLPQDCVEKMIRLGGITARKP
jgi:hypothetical protein